MPEVEYACFFDNSKQCPARTALKGIFGAQSVTVDRVLEKACPICPIRAKLMKGKGSLK